MQPRVSVIVPVLDAASHVGRCVEALLAQSYPADRLEVIFVDNGSIDETRARVREHPVTLLVERSLRSPYTARNTGIRHAGGEILAFTDSDCVPAKDWLERGVARLEEQGADLAGGRVRFSFSERRSAAELFDAITNLDNERSVAERGVAKTGNLLVRRRVFDEVGLFEEGRRSGGDVEFTSRATGAGFTIVFSAEAVVEKPARRAWALARKQYRVGRGQMLLWRRRGQTGREMLPKILRCFRPVRPAQIRERLRRRGPRGGERRSVGVWLAAWWLTAVQGLGRLHEWVVGGANRR